MNSIIKGGHFKYKCSLILFNYNKFILILYQENLISKISKVYSKFSQRDHKDTYFTTIYDLLGQVQFFYISFSVL
jgi:hypothetical protein